MRLILIVSLLFSSMAWSQTRVKENIKQKAVATSEDSNVKVKAPGKKKKIK